MVQTGIYNVQIVWPSPLFFALIAASLLLLPVAFLHREKRARFAVGSVSLMSLGVLFHYGASNFGLPRVVDQSRLQFFVALAYALVGASVYWLMCERLLFARLLRGACFKGSLVLMCLLTAAAVWLTPRWTDTDVYRRAINDMEYSDTPYVIYRIQEDFQPFTYTVVSYVEGFSQVLSRGYHMNVQDMHREYDPLDRALKIPTDHVFICVESAPLDYMGLGQYYYRWRRDIMLKLKDWVALYGSAHDNLKLWYKSDRLLVYVIDNQDEADRLEGRRQQLRVR
jgi:hypothetical protein